MSADANHRHDCCIVGCGPAGAMLGLLLARAGLDVLVLEKHGDFFRDFRGDTIHPSTLELLDQLGLAERFLRLPHSEVATLMFPVPSGPPLAFTFRRLKTRFPFIAFVPQWDFLDFITDEAKRYPGFRLEMNAEATDLIQDNGVVRGVRYRTPDGAREARARLTVGADGRSSRTREAAGLRLVETAAPIDVFWFRLSRRPEEPVALVARVAPGRFGVLIDRGDYWQVGYLIPKGGADAIRAAGLAAFRQSVAALFPDLADRVDELRQWDQAKLLTVQSNRLARWWKAGYLAIGDAAHAMSPVGGVGINVAIQDAVVAANTLWRP
ncbi:MAG TPA: FAD-dependent oxidoreductase, partial [Thermomicrobiales bacterium]|nr:FAD-dependent oxidoreductase [Thermomicrobiales bacterium]